MYKGTDIWLLILAAAQAAVGSFLAIVNNGFGRLIGIALVVVSLTTVVLQAHKIRQRLAHRGDPQV